MKAHAVCKNQEDLSALLERFDPIIHDIKEINGMPIGNFGDIYGTVLTFNCNKDSISDFAMENAPRFRDKVKSYIVSNRYQSISFKDIASEVIDSMSQKLSIVPDKYFINFKPGRVQILMDFNRLQNRYIPDSIIPFEQSINNPSVLDYRIPEAGKNVMEVYNQGMLLDIGYNGKQGISMYPTYLRCFCENLSIDVDKTTNAENFSHISPFLLEKIARSIADSDEFFDDYEKTLNFARFCEFVKNTFGKKAIDFVLSLSFIDDVINNFCVYYATNVVTLLQRGIGNVRGYSFMPKAIEATKKYKDFIASE